MADDVLARLAPAEVAAFYSRLADGVDSRKGKLDVSLAALLMRLGLSNRAPGAALTVVGIEMLPIGLLLVAQDVPFLKKPVGHGMLWLEHRWARWKKRREASKREVAKAPH